MVGPGERIETVLSRLPIKQVAAICSDAVIALVRADHGERTETDAIRRAAQQQLKLSPELLKSRPEIAHLIVKGLDKTKQAELEKRLGMTTRALISGRERNNRAWEKFYGFFGLAYAAPSFNESQSESVDVDPQFGLFAHQRDAANRVWKVIGRGRGRVILHMPTGAGKTRTAMHLVCRFLEENEPSVVLWLASTAELLEQAEDAFEKAWLSLGNRHLRSRRAWGSADGHLSDVEDGILIGGFQKLTAGLNNPDMKRYFDNLSRRVGLVVVDEAHQSIAPTYRDLIDTLTSRGRHDALLGLTATPGRTWNDRARDAELAGYYDNTKVILEIDGYSDPVTYLMADGYLARPEFRNLEFGESTEEEPETGLYDYSDELRERLAFDARRNKLILEETLKLIEEGHTRILIFAATVAHATALTVALRLRDIDCDAVTGVSSKSERKKVIRDFKRPTPKPKIICNFGVLTTGFDAPKTSAAIIARPTRSLVLFSQMVGRVTRGTKAGGNETCVVSTIVDTSLPGFRNVSEAFTNWEDVYE